MSNLSYAHFQKGDKVEVLKQENGLNTYTYYAATVLGSPTTLKTQILIKYQTSMIKESNAQKPMTELVDLASVRPMPPRELYECFKNGDSVDVFCDNGWQKGTVKDILENSKYVVGFDGKSEGIVAEQCNLRLHRDWDHDGSSWVLPLLENTMLPATDTKSRKLRMKMKCEGRESEPMFRIGARVEVKSDEEGYVGAWFSAIINGTIGNDKLLVQYLNLLTDDETAPLRELVDAGHVRPCPPPVPSDAGFKEFDKVDVWYNDGWWEGEVSGVLHGSKYMVYFRSTNDNLEFDDSALRHHQKWIDGKWVQEKSIKLDTIERIPKTKFSKGTVLEVKSDKVGLQQDDKIPKAQFSKGAMVEVKTDEVGFQGAWFAATIVNVMDSDKYEVQYQSLLTDDGTDFLREQARASDLRPSPPHIERGYSYRLFETVDAWYNDAWWVGRISKVHTNSTYTVVFKTMEELEFAHSDLRPHQEWVNGYWVTTPMEQSIKLDTIERIPKAKFSKRTMLGVKSDKAGFQRDEKIPKAQFSKGTMVEVKTDEVGFQGAWFAATIVNMMDSDIYEVQYQRLLTDDGSAFLREQARASDLRPSPPHIERGYSYRLFETVDAWYNDAWWVGRISKVHTNSTYTVDFKTTEELEFAHSELRPHQEWVNGHWVTAPMDWGV